MTLKKGGVLAGIRVLDVAHAYSAALTGSLLADLGADVICVEHPTGSQVRQTLPKSKGQALWWKNMARGKRCITLDLGSARGRELFLQIVPQFDLMVENFRPGTLERWGIGPADLEKAGANLSLLRISGFGQTGPKRDRPGYGTTAEAFSGFAHLNGFPDGPPVFPSIALADGVSATFGAFGLMASMVNRLRTGRKGVDVVDVALFESLFRLSPVQVLAFDQLGMNLKRPGNLLSALGLIRNLYTTKDDVNFVVSTVGATTIRRLIVCAEVSADLIAQLDNGIMKGSNEEITKFILACDAQIKDWAAARNWDEVSAKLKAADAVYEQVYTTADIMSDDHYRAREDIVTVPDTELGEIKMTGVMPKFSDFSHTVRNGGPGLGEHNGEVYRELFGFGETELAQLKEDKVI